MPENKQPEQKYLIQSTLDICEAITRFALCAEENIKGKNIVFKNEKVFSQWIELFSDIENHKHSSDDVNSYSDYSIRVREMDNANMYQEENMNKKALPLSEAPEINPINITGSNEIINTIDAARVVTRIAKTNSDTTLPEYGVENYDAYNALSVFSKKIAEEDKKNYTTSNKHIVDGIKKIQETFKLQQLINAFKELQKGACDAGIAMHFREIANASDTAKKYLGTDAVELQKSKEFKQLTKEEQDRIKKSGNLGEYGFYHHALKRETKVSLEVMKVIAAREIIEFNQDFKNEIPDAQYDKKRLIERINAETNLGKTYLENIQSKEFVENILTTFTDGNITKEKIEQAMTPFKVPQPQ